MTDLSTRDAIRLGHDELPLYRPTSRLVLFSAFALASAAGLLIGHASLGDASAFEPTLVLLLRFMAAMKSVGAVAALALAAWRLGRPAPRRVAIGYSGAVTLMAIAPGMIWSLAHIGLAAGLFHGGLLGFLVLAWTDQDMVGRRVRG